MPAHSNYSDYVKNKPLRMHVHMCGACNHLSGAKSCLADKYDTFWLHACADEDDLLAPVAVA